MKIMITGAKGQLGRELCRQLENGGSVLGPLPPALHKATIIAVDMDDADLTDRKQAADLVRHHMPDAVINCAAFTAVDAAEEQTDAAFGANALAPRNLAMACQETGAKLVHISTDYVFSGDATRPVVETDIPAPKSVYGSTKLLGEEYVQRFCSQWFIVRTAWLYSRFGNNFVKTMQRLGAQRDQLKVVDDQVGNPTNAEDLAHHLLALLPTQEYGIYHCTGGGICSWFAFAREIIRLSGGKAQVLPCTSEEYQQMAPQAAPRPAYSALEHAMLRATIGDNMRPWQQALEHYYSEQNQEAEK